MFTRLAPSRTRDTFDYDYEAQANGQGAMRFVVTGRSDRRSEVDSLAVTDAAGSPPVPAGRGDGARAMDGAAVAWATQAQCWDDSFRQTYNYKPWTTPMQNVGGDPSVCPDIPALLRSRRAHGALDPRWVTVVPCAFPAGPQRRKKDDDLGRALSQNRSPLRPPAGDRGPVRGQEADLADAQHLAGRSLSGIRERRCRSARPCSFASSFRRSPSRSRSRATCAGS